MTVLVKCKVTCYRPSVAQRVGRDTVLLFHDHSTRRGWVVRSTPRPHSTPRKDAIPILQEAGWAPGLVWTAGKSRPHRDLILDRPARSQSLYRLSYRAHWLCWYLNFIVGFMKNILLGPKKKRNKPYFVENKTKVLQNVLKLQLGFLLPEYIKRNPRGVF